MRRRANKRNSVDNNEGRRERKRIEIEEERGRKEKGDFHDVWTMESRRSES